MRNQDKPLKDVLKDKGPGVYLAVVERADVKEGEDTGSVTNWVLVSNLGLTAYTGADGMAVAVRSLARLPILSFSEAAIRRARIRCRPAHHR